MKTTKQDQIINDIMFKINDGTLKPGEKLPTNKEFAVQYKTSEVTVRKSIATLVRMGFVESIERIGSFVKEREKDIFTITLSPYVNINEEITEETVESISLSLITMRDPQRLHQVVEIQKVLYSGPIPICYMINSVIISDRYSSKSHIRMFENRQETIDRILNSFEVKKEFEITMDSPDHYIYNKLFLREQDPIMCFKIYYYTKDDKPIGKSVYFASGQNIELKGLVDYVVKY